MFPEKPFRSTLCFWSGIFLPGFDTAHGPGESSAGSGSGALGIPSSCFLRGLGEDKGGKV